MPEIEYLLKLVALLTFFYGLAVLCVAILDMIIIHMRQGDIKDCLFRTSWAIKYYSALYFVFIFLLLTVAISCNCNILTTN